MRPGAIMCNQGEGPPRRTSIPPAPRPSRPPPPPLLRPAGECIWLHLPLIADCLRSCHEIFPSARRSRDAPEIPPCRSTELTAQHTQSSPLGPAPFRPAPSARIVVSRPGVAAPSPGPPTLGRSTTPTPPPPPTPPAKSARAPSPPPPPLSRTPLPPSRLCPPYALSPRTAPPSLPRQDFCSARRRPGPCCAGRCASRPPRCRRSSSTTRPPRTPRSLWLRAGRTPAAGLTAAAAVSRPSSCRASPRRRRASA